MQAIRKVFFHSINPFHLICTEKEVRYYKNPEKIFGIFVKLSVKKNGVYYGLQSFLLAGAGKLCRAELFGISGKLLK